VGFLTTIEESDAAGGTAEVYASEHERVGYLPQYAQVFGERPAVYRAWRQLISEVTASMPTRRFELVTLAAARELRSSYCSVAHGAILADRFLTVDDVAQLAKGDVPDALDECERAVVSFASKVATSAADVSSEDIEQLRSQGLDDAEILDVVLATAVRCFFSTVLEATGTQADAVYAERLDSTLRDALTVGRPIATR
jgi:uncharacterized peroxidase-related enzyme